MNDILQIMLWPFIASLVLAGIHAYLGLHVVERGVIFVDLSLAQVAALGSAVALLSGYDLHGRSAYFLSLGFTLVGAGLFSVTRSRRTRIPQEALIGIVYAMSAALAILIMDRLPEGSEHIKHILVGNLLAVSPWEVQKMALLYAFIGALHWFWRKPFLTISTDPEEASRKGYRVKLWDFLFYATFGFVVTSSVAIAGVLLVFTYLIVPSVTAMLFSESVGTRLAIGWTMGGAASLLGMYFSFRFDAPTGATVICVFGVLLACLSILRATVLRRAFK
ncbi:MAG: ABC transporter [Elusimicrobia bacterium RIFCSPHIGHO2_02_FULL_57_9]|nr:MAG: ABC transporter [Elusimicrobia bacterium RIFCSPHIGHO2_02_FULL_57_9]